MKSLVVFYSLEGHTKMIADLITEQLGADQLQLIPKKEMPKTSFKKYLWGGKSVLFKEKPELQNEIPDLNEYDTIIIGTPIWAGIYTPPVNTFLFENSIQNKKVGFFACHAGGGAKKCFDKLAKQLANNSLVGNMEFIDPGEANKEVVKEEVEHWVKSICEMNK